MISIIICNWNTLDWLRRCVKSVRDNTKMDYELIIIDNGSTEEGTKDFIELHADKSKFNEKNLGYARGNNQGADLAEGGFLCFLNSDTIVTDGWLEEMMETLKNNPECAAVGPLGNTQFREIQGTIYRYHQHIGEFKVDTKVNFLVGFCMLIKKEAFDKVKWDSLFDYGLFEDNMICRQLRKLGYELWVSANSYVIHPNPSRSFEANGLDYHTVHKKNERKFVEKLKEMENDKRKN